MQPVNSNLEWEPNRKTFTSVGDVSGKASEARDIALSAINHIQDFSALRNIMDSSGQKLDQIEKQLKYRADKLSKLTASTSADSISAMGKKLVFSGEINKNQIKLKILEEQKNYYDTIKSAASYRFVVLGEPMVKNKFNGDIGAKLTYDTSASSSPVDKTLCTQLTKISKKTDKAALLSVGRDLWRTINKFTVIDENTPQPILKAEKADANDRNSQRAAKIEQLAKFICQKAGLNLDNEITAYFQKTSFSIDIHVNDFLTWLYEKVAKSGISDEKKGQFVQLFRLFIQNHNNNTASALWFKLNFKTDQGIEIKFNENPQDPHKHYGLTLHADGSSTLNIVQILQPRFAQLELGSQLMNTRIEFDKDFECTRVVSVPMK